MSASKVLDSLDSMTAFEEVRNDLGDVEALLTAALVALADLPRLHDSSERRRLGRLGSLVEAAAHAATSALDKADAMLEKATR